MSLFCPWLIWASPFWQHLITKPEVNASQKAKRLKRAAEEKKTATAWNLAVNILHVKPVGVKGGMTKDYKTQGTDLKLCQQSIEAAAEEEDSA